MNERDGCWACMSGWEREDSNGLQKLESGRVSEGKRLAGSKQSHRRLILPHCGRALGPEPWPQPALVKHQGFTSPIINPPGLTAFLLSFSKTHFCPITVIYLGAIGKKRLIQYWEQGYLRGQSQNSTRIQILRRTHWLGLSLTVTLDKSIWTSKNRQKT